MKMMIKAIPLPILWSTRELIDIINNYIKQITLSKVHSVNYVIFRRWLIQYIMITIVYETKDLAVYD